MSRSPGRSALVISGDDTCGSAIGEYLNAQNWKVLRVIPEVMSNPSQYQESERRAAATQLEVQVRTAANQMGGLDGLVCVLPREDQRHFAHLEWDCWSSVVRSHVDLVARSCASALPHLATGGSIVMVCSRIGADGSPKAAHAAAADGAVIGFTKCLALELASRQITVNTVLASPWTAGPLPGAHDAIAGAVRYLLEEASYVTAQTIDVNAIGDEGQAE